MACTCKDTPHADVIKLHWQKAHWRITKYKFNNSRFHGGYQSSDYSEVLCRQCRKAWRTKANYVQSLRQISDEEREAYLMNKPFPP